jgi:hypothetical protein
MKNLAFTFCSIVILMSAVSFTACEKDKDDSGTGALNNNNNDTNDTTPPAITIMGANPTYHTLNSAYSDPGATAIDDEDGLIPVTSNFSSTNPNVNMAGTYSITYLATDSAGNQASATRTVIVENSAVNLAGSYLVEDTCYSCSGISFSYIQNIAASTTVNGRIHFSKFADYSNNSGIYADVSGTSVTLPSQTAINIGSFAEDHQFSGSGSFLTSPNVVIHLNYTDFNINNSSVATCSAWFVKQ